MKIIHTSDLHIGSPLTSRLGQREAQIRRRELLTTLDEIIAAARREGAEAIIIAGDLFDSERVTKSAKSRVYDSVKRASDITFIYVAGNHEGDTVARDKTPENLIILSGDGWSYHTTGGVTFAGTSRLGAGTFDGYCPSEGINIAVLHGELRAGGEGSVSPKEAASHSLDYIALGHYHTYSSVRIDERCCAVYSGAPHGRGFDEAGVLGYVVIDTDEKPISHRFVPLGTRRIHIKEVDATGALGTLDIESRIEKAAADVRRDDLLRVVLTGDRSIDYTPDTAAIYDRFVNNYFYFEIKDETKVKIDVEELMYNKTLKGEFIRLVMSDGGLSDTEKGKIIDFGLRALMGDTPDE